MKTYLWHLSTEDQWGMEELSPNYMLRTPKMVNYPAGASKLNGKYFVKLDNL